MVDSLKLHGINVEIMDPWVSIERFRDLNLKGVSDFKQAYYDAIILAVSHETFFSIPPSELVDTCKPKHIIFDLKYALDKDDSDLRM